MDIVLPPALFYGVGIVLIVFGALRAVFLGWKQKREAAAQPQEDPEAAGAGPVPGGLAAVVGAAATSAT